MYGRTVVTYRKSPEYTRPSPMVAPCSPVEKRVANQKIKAAVQVQDFTPRTEPRWPNQLTNTASFGYIVGTVIMKSIEKLYVILKTTSQL